MKTKKTDLIVVGGGAAGLMAAICAAREGVSVLVLDHHTMPAKKLLATGNGKCNFTNKMQGSGCYRCDDPAFVLQTLEQFDASQSIAFFEALGVLVKERQGYCYPRTGQAAAIRNALLFELQRLRVPIIADIGIRLIQKESDVFWLQTKSGTYKADACILATGGKASPKTGSDGSGYIYACKLGHTLTEPLPALVPLLADAPWLNETAGVRCDAAVTLLIDGQERAVDCGEIQMTAYGISGIPVFQVSRYAAAALHKKQQVQAKLDFLPEKEENTCRHFLSLCAEQMGHIQNWNALLSGLVNQKISTMIVQQLNLPEMPVKAQNDKKIQKQLRDIVRLLKGTILTIHGTKSFDQAQVTCGGIAVNEIHARTMESKLLPGLFFAGEIMDVDGICGGYNLQWAWSSGYAAGISSAKRIKQNRKS